MTDKTTHGYTSWSKPLDESLYVLDDEEKAFFKAATKIDDDDELKRHIIAVQTKAFGMYNYPCIRIFEFARLKMARLPAYPDLLKLGKERKGAIYVDFGCCFGNDVRKAVLDGYPPENIVTTDISKALWDLGHEMFRSTPSTFPVHFLEGDVLNPAFLEVVPRSTSVASTADPAISTLTSLNPLHGRVSAIFAGAFFHLFSYETQLHIARAFAGLISPLPGSLIFGVQGGNFEKSRWAPTGNQGGYGMSTHSPESWKEMWEEVFGKGKVEVKGKLRKEDGGDSFHGTFPGNTNPYHVLEWSVTVL